ncbi:DUF4168 domain-containing protein [Leptolyngbya sp. CCNP1308]|uniref:DUF4168 domain-containing protein n=1 Tax=Leptolyngbya sp. CCNP1308 TaxID=3110255 RepID=UPI002B20B1D9|nr:DUF4168 domain-containing protein [Leptolyngbya sp. CCNP1308]MEA5452290.1 DUF4168 domain-containing protein [Leptolyngbya sp. CCNP1308]
MIHLSTHPLSVHRRTLALAAAIASLAVLAGGAGVSLPTTTGSVTLGAAAWAQDSSVSSEEVTGYAASVLEMDTPRNEAFSQIKTLLTGTSYDISSIDMSCTGTANLNQLPRNLRSDVRTIVVNYCNQASTIVQSNGLTVRRFNAITSAYPQDPALAEQIRAAMVQLQQQSANGSE